MEDKHIFKHNDDINYLLQRKLSFVLQYGMIFLFLLGLVVLIILYFIKVPDTLEGKFTLTSNNPPKSLIAKMNGRILYKKIKDKQSVKQGEILLVLESVANAEEVLRVENLLELTKCNIDSNEFDSLSNIGINEFNQLGEVQQAFEQFKKSNNELYMVLTNGQYKLEKKLIETRLKNLFKTKINILDQKSLYERDIELANESWKTDSILVLQKSISKTEFRNTESTKLMKKLGLNNLRQNIISNESAINDIEQQLLNLEKSIFQQKNAYFQNYAILKTAIDDWKSKFLLISTFDGKVSFNRNIYEGLQVNIGDPLIYLIPNGSSWVGELFIPQQNFGKLKINQRAILKFDSYNFEEFGIVEGKVTSISTIPQEMKSADGIQNLFMVQIGLDSLLATSFHQRIEPRFGLSGSCAIALDDKSILEKLFLDKFKALFIYQ